KDTAAPGIPLTQRAGLSAADRMREEQRRNRCARLGVSKSLPPPTTEPGLCAGATVSYLRRLLSSISVRSKDGRMLRKAWSNRQHHAGFDARQRKPGTAPAASGQEAKPPLWQRFIHAATAALAALVQQC